jgi:hypothetical protein
MCSQPCSKSPWNAPGTQMVLVSVTGRAERRDDFARPTLDCASRKIGAKQEQKSIAKKQCSGRLPECQSARERTSAKLRRLVGAKREFAHNRDDHNRHNNDHRTTRAQRPPAYKRCGYQQRTLRFSTDFSSSLSPIAFPLPLASTFLAIALSRGTQKNTRKGA